MCGIAGLLASTGIDAGALATMTSTMRHRGPDDEGYLLLDASGAVAIRRGDDSVDDALAGDTHILGSGSSGVVAGLGHRRLSIIDVTSAGHQPMADDSGRYWVVFNGEIYNYLELREELRSLGRTFRSGSDTEVLLQAYAEWGEGCVSRFDGMFAFAILDVQSGRLFCARDRLGVKPFYYHAEDGNFAFASELKALLALPSTPREVDESVMAAFLAYGQHDRDHRTFFRGVYALPAGCVLTVTPGRAPEVTRYWQLTPGPVGRFDADSAESTAGHVRSLFREAIQRRLRSDVPVGFCLSGGIDSSSIVSMASQIVEASPVGQVGSDLRAFTSYFDEPALDERRFADAVTDGRAVRSIRTSPTGDDLIREWDRMTWHQDEPIAGPSVFMQHDLMRLVAANGVRVVLDGQGGDELFGGYRPHQGAHLRDQLLRGRLSEVATLGRDGGLNPWLHAGHQAAHAIAGRIFERVEGQLRPRATAGLLSPEVIALARDEQLCAPTGSLNEVLAGDLTAYMLPHLLRYEDRNSMAFSVEARVPLSDSAGLLDFVPALASSLKIHQGWSKFLLREAMRGVLPEEVRARRSKLGFTVPVADWGRTVATSDLGTAMLDASSEYVSRDTMIGLVRAASEGKASGLFWRLLSVIRWQEIVLTAPTGSAR